MRSFNAHIIRKKLMTAGFIALSVAAFATLGDGRSATRPTQRGGASYHKLLSVRPSAALRPGFSLRSGYAYKADRILEPSAPVPFDLMSTTVTYQKGNTTYILPLKSKGFLDKVKINPAPQKF
ncbi:hypothetical protein [Flaviaesturariibacter amylovorans]|uniref:Uncharacterized protein n=1 Tax=Flaviaesturariibacter amylovorans TaxID=1084520 RepID=A0ABP8GMP3_9BACT